MTDRNSSFEPTSMSRRPAFMFAAVFGLGAALVFAFALTGFVYPGGLAPSQSWWLMIVALGVATIGLSAFSAWRTAGLVAATFLFGMGAQLALKDPLWFQHFQFRPTSTISYALLAAPAAQAAATGLVLLQKNVFKHASRVLAELGRMRVLLLVLILFAGSMGAMDYFAQHDYRALLKQLVIASAFMGLNIVSFVALVVAAPADQAQKLGHWLSQAISLPASGDQARRLDKAFPFWLAGGVFLLCVFFRFVVFDNTPRIDEVLYLFQAQYFAHGHVTLALPPAPTEAFDIFMMNTHAGRWFATWPPGWPMVLAIGVFVGVPWIVNPLLGGVTVLLLHSLVKSSSDRGMANLAALLMAISPWFVWSASTLMSHTATLAMVLGAWVLLIRTRRKPSIIAPFAAGALLGLDFLTRPLEGVMMGVLTGLWTLTFLSDRRQWITVLLYGLGCICVGALIFPYDAQLTGSPLLVPLNEYLDRVWGPGANRLGFGANIGASPNWGAVDPFKGHSPLEALVQIQHCFYVLNFELLGWAVGSVAFALIFFLWGRWTKLTAAMAIVAAMTIFVHAFYWYAAFDYAGPRYWSMLLAPMLVLTAAGIPVCMGTFRRIFPHAAAPQRIGVGVVFLALCSVLVFSSWQGFTKYPGYRGYHDDYRGIAQQARFRDSLVFVTGGPAVEYENAFWLNDFNGPSNRPIFARDLGREKNLRVAQAYPGRRIYFVNGRVRRAGEWRHVEIARGPLTIQDLSAASP